MANPTKGIGLVGGQLLAEETTVDGPSTNSPLVNEVLRQDKLIANLTEAYLSLRDKLSPFVGATAEPVEKELKPDSYGSSEFVRVISDNNDRIESVIKNINATKWALEI